jgi:hypothetical protein
MHLDLTDDETAALLRELDGLIDSDRYFLSPRIKTLKAIRAKIRPEPLREPLPPPPKPCAPPRATARQRRRAGTLTCRTRGGTLRKGEISLPP